MIVTFNSNTNSKKDKIITLLAELLADQYDKEVEIHEDN